MKTMGAAKLTAPILVCGDYVITQFAQCFALYLRKDSARSRRFRQSVMTKMNKAMMRAMATIINPIAPAVIVATGSRA